jgi:hypothetical protein
MFSKRLTLRNNFMHRNDSAECETGHQFESSFVGECRVSWAGEYVGYSKALEMVRRNQPQDAVHERGAALLREVASALSVALNKQVAVSELKLLSALGTPFDRYHGVDAVIEFRGMVAPLDFKLRKLDSRKAFVIRPSDVDSAFGTVSFVIARFFGLTARTRGISLA